MTTPEIGVCLAALADRPLVDALAQVRALDLSLVDLPTDSVFRVRPDDAGEVRRALDRFAIRVACVSNSRDCQLILGPHGPHTDRVRRGDPATKRAHGEAAAVDAIRWAAELGAPLVRLFFGCPDFARWLTWSGSAISWADNVDQFVHVAAPLAETARAEGVALCIEAHPKQVPFDASSVLACVAGVRAAGTDLGICFDAANVAALRYDPVDFLDAIDEVPVCVHAKDVELDHSALPPTDPGWVAYGPQPAVRFRGVAAGNLDWPGIVTKLEELGYDGPVLIEHEDLLCDPVTGIAAAHRYLDALLGSTSVPPEADPARVSVAAVRSAPWW